MASLPAAKALPWRFLFRFVSPELLSAPAVLARTEAASNIEIGPPPEAHQMSAGEDPQFEYAGFWRRVLARLVDAALVLALLPVTIPITMFAYERRTLVLQALPSAIWMVFFIFLVVKFGGTPGKLLLGVRVVNGEGRFISVSAALLRDLFGIIAFVLSCLKTAHIFATLPVMEMPQGFLELGRIVRPYCGVWRAIKMIYPIIFYVDVLVILFNKKKRALHDFIAGSYVITRKSFLAVTSVEKDERQGN